MSNINNESIKEDIEEMLLNDPSFIHDLIMGKYGYHPEERAARVNAKVQEIFEDRTI